MARAIIETPSVFGPWIDLTAPDGRRFEVVPTIAEEVEAAEREEAETQEAIERMRVDANQGRERLEFTADRADAELAELAEQWDREEPI